MRACMQTHINPRTFWIYATKTKQKNLKVKIKFFHILFLKFILKIRKKKNAIMSRNRVFTMTVEPSTLTAVQPWFMYLDIIWKDYFDRMHTLTYKLLPLLRDRTVSSYNLERVTKKCIYWIFQRVQLPHCSSRMLRVTVVLIWDVNETKVHKNAPKRKQSSLIIRTAPSQEESVHFYCLGRGTAHGGQKAEWISGIYPRKLEAIIAAIGASTKYRIKVLIWSLSFWVIEHTIVPSITMIINLRHHGAHWWIMSSSGVNLMLSGNKGYEGR